jgi:hypothetical protein
MASPMTDVTAAGAPGLLVELSGRVAAWFDRWL